MPTITGFRQRGDKAKVYVEGDFWAEIDAGVALERGLYKGAELSEEELSEARRFGERALAMSRALNFLGYRARAAGEIRDRLRRYGYAGDIVEEVLGRLTELGYVDDLEFARTAAHEKALKYGPRRVFTDLRMKGVEEETVRKVVEEEFRGRSELEDARSAAARRYNTGKGSDAESRRVYGFLARRGYSTVVCAEVARGYGYSRTEEADE